MKTALLGLVLFPLCVVAAPVNLKVDKALSHVEIIVHATVDSFTGHLTDFEPTIVLDDAGQIQAATIKSHFGDVKTGKGDRDEQMHDWQDTAEYPDMVFELATLTPAKDGGLLAKGKLTLHGVTQELSFPVSISRDGALMAIDGTVHLDTQNFGLPIIRKFLVLKVDPKVDVRFHLQGRPEEVTR